MQSAQGLSWNNDALMAVVCEVNCIKNKFAGQSVSSILGKREPTNTQDAWLLLCSILKTAPLIRHVHWKNEHDRCRTYKNSFYCTVKGDHHYPIFCF